MSSSLVPAAGAIPVEIELKLAVPAGAVAELERRLRALGDPRVLQLDTVYYDTASRALREARAALRLRRVDGGWVQTLKTGHADAALARRGEWEMPVAAARLELARLQDTPLAALLGAAPGRLAPVFRTRFERQALVVRRGEARVELAFDRGSIRAGRRAEALCELELEALDGGPAALFEIALELAGRGREALALLPSVESKAARGYRLADARAAEPLPAGAEGFHAVLDAGMRSGAAARRVVEHGVNRVLSNLAGAAAGVDPEFVHQSRVALRRTRSALRLLQPAAGDGDPVARELRWMGRQYGAMRDWDVLVTQWLPALQPWIGSTDGAAWARAQARAQARRGALQARMAARLLSPRFARSALLLLQWSQTGAPAGPSLGVVAPKALERGRRRLLAAGRGLERLSAPRRHRLRILAKRQRYAIELLAPFANRPEPARVLRLLARLQQALGEANDTEVLRQVLPSLTASRHIQDAAARWARRSLKKTLPKAAALVERLRRLDD